MNLYYIILLLIIILIILLKINRINENFITECGLLNRDDCLSSPECGYCERTAKCMNGSNTSPLFGMCDDWSYGQKDLMKTPKKREKKVKNVLKYDDIKRNIEEEFFKEDCRRITNPDKCLSKNYCNLCEDGNQCIPGKETGPTEDKCERWLHRLRTYKDKNIEAKAEEKRQLKNISPISTEKRPTIKNCVNIKTAKDCLKLPYCVFCSQNNTCLNGDKFGAVFPTDCNGDWVYGIENYKKELDINNIPKKPKQVIKPNDNCDCEKFNHDDKNCLKCKNCGYCAETGLCTSNKNKAVAQMCRMNWKV